MLLKIEAAFTFALVEIGQAHRTAMMDRNRGNRGNFISRSFPARLLGPAGAGLCRSEFALGGGVGRFLGGNLVEDFLQF